MTYATQADIEARYPGWLTLAGPINETTKVLDTVAMGLACAAADDPINRALLTIGWSVPVVAPIPGWLLNLAVDMARYFATSTAVASEEMLKDVRKRYDDALNALDDIASGQIIPPPLVNGSGTASVGMIAGSNPRLFGRGVL